MQTQPWAHTTSASALIKAFDILEELNILLVGIQHIGPYILHVIARRVKRVEAVETYSLYRCGV